MTTTRLPILFLNDLVVLPGMVVPVELDDAAKSAIDAARAHSDDSLLVAPRLHDRYASYGVVASIVQLGRLQNGDPAAVLKADRRVKIGSGVSGPGTALWIEAEELDPTFETEEIRELAAEYKGLLIATLQRRDAWQVIDTVNKVTEASALADLAGYASWLTDEQKRELLETPYVADRLRVLVEWVTTHIAETEVNDKIADDVREGMEKSQREFLLRQQLQAIRKELGEDAIVGSFCGGSRHDGMTAAEHGADYVSFGPAGDSALYRGEPAGLELFQWWSGMIEVPVVAEGAITRELIASLSPACDFIAIGAEIWGEEDPLDALGLLWN